MVTEAPGLLCKFSDSKKRNNFSQPGTDFRQIPVIPVALRSVPDFLALCVQCSSILDLSTYVSYVVCRRVLESRMV